MEERVVDLPTSPILFIPSGKLVFFVGEVFSPIAWSPKPFNQAYIYITLHTNWLSALHLLLSLVFAKKLYNRSLFASN
jgi:hypothetical protein